jgi:hypothetical protein
MAFPLTDKVTNLDFFSQTPTLISTSLSGKEQRAQLSSQKWAVRMTLNSLSDADRRTLQSFVQEQNGSLTAFELELPSDLADSSGGYTGAITTDGAHSAGATTVSISTSASSGTYAVKKGDLIRFAGAVKTYMVTSKTFVDVSGDATISISPSLQTDVSTTTSVTHTNVSLNVRIDNEFKYTARQELFANTKMEFIEVI